MGVLLAAGVFCRRQAPYGNIQTQWLQAAGMKSGRQGGRERVLSKDEARHRDRLSCMEKGQVSESHSHPIHSPVLSRTSSKSLEGLGGSRWSYWGLG